jgi:hypothetical protein
MCHRTEVEPQSPAYDTLTKTIAVKVPRLAVTVYASLDGWMVDMAKPAQSHDVEQRRIRESW